MKKIAYIIPGYEETHLKQRGYNKIAKFFEAQGIDVVHVEIDWKRQLPRQFDDYGSDFLQVYKKQKNVETYILGFSFGALTAFLTAAKTKPTALILCSLSPYFTEDLQDAKKPWIRWWNKTYIDSTYSFAKLAPKILAKTYLIVGDKELDVCLIRAKEGKKKMPHATVIMAKGAKHKIGQKEYLNTVQKVIAKL